MTKHSNSCLEHTFWYPQNTDLGCVKDKQVVCVGLWAHIPRKYVEMFSWAKQNIGTEKTRQRQRPPLKNCPMD